MTAYCEEFLKLMYGARGRFVTAHATVREWRDEMTADDVLVRMSASEAYHKIFGPPKSQGQGFPRKNGKSERTWRVWHERPNRWRQEIESAGRSGTEYRVVDGDAFWYYNSLHGSRHAIATRSEFGGGFGAEFEIAHVFDPAVPHLELEELELRPAGRTRAAGREAIRLEAVKPGGWEYPPEPLWWGADDYELLVDAERGLILRLASRLGGLAFDMTEVLEIAFDETLPEGTFVLDLPGVEFGEPERLT